MVRALFILMMVSACCGQDAYLQHRRTASRELPGGGGGGGGHNPPASPLLLETFEGTGYSNTGWTETLNGGTIDEDYTGVVLDGAQSLQIVTAGFASTYVTRTITAAGNRWFFFQFRAGVLNGTQSIFDMADNVSAVQGHIEVSSGGTVTAFAGAVSASCVATMSLNTKYNIWVEYNKNNGANRICNVAFSTSTTRPTSGNNYAQASTTTSATDISELYLGNFTTDFSDTRTYILDYFMVDDAQIGDNP